MVAITRLSPECGAEKLSGWMESGIKITSALYESMDAHCATIDGQQEALILGHSTVIHIKYPAITPVS